MAGILSPVLRVKVFLMTLVSMSTPVHFTSNVHSLGVFEVRHCVQLVVVEIRSRIEREKIEDKGHWVFITAKNTIPRKLFWERRGKNRKY